MQRDAERLRLEAARQGNEPWRRWGPYLSERQWGTVREDYSPHGTAWDYLPHDHARSRAYRWGEDGLAGFSDDQQRLCLGLALWNGRDPILKERLFGLTNGEGNHGEDVKELYYYLDATPTHSYLKMLYKYPQREFPYAWLAEENRRRGKDQPEFELLDTGVFDDDRYFDVFVEYAKAGPDDILMLVTVHNRGPEAADIHLLPQLWFRNTWSWEHGAPRPRLGLALEGAKGKGAESRNRGAEDGEHGAMSRAQPGAERAERSNGVPSAHPAVARHDELGEYHFFADGEPTWIFCENETNARRLFGTEGATPYPKDAFHEYVVSGRSDAVNPAHAGTKAGALYRATIPAGGSARFRLRLQSKTQNPESRIREPFGEFDALLESRRREADTFYAALQQDIRDADARHVQRQALAGMIWNKQFYYFDVPRWLAGDPAQPPPPDERRRGRNHEWLHLNNADIISMPDKWEYPWYAAWDLAFHSIPLALIDAEFAKHQLVLLTREWYMHPNGQLPAYEWAFGDVNPPVHAWAAWRVFQIDRKQRRQAGEPDYAGDLPFLERVFHKLMLNFTWWVNRKDAQGRNVFQGGFLGLDNIGVFDRSAPLPTGGFINQADGTSWMAMYCLNLMRIALELALHNHVYEDIATKFFEHFLSIAEAMNGIGGDVTRGSALRQRQLPQATYEPTASGPGQSRRSAASPSGTKPTGAPQSGATQSFAPGSRDTSDGVALWCDEDQFYYDVLNLPDGRVVPLKVRSMVGLIPLFAVETLEPELLDKLPEFKKRLEWFLNNRPDLAALVSRWHEPGRGDRRLLSLLRGHRMKALLRRMLDESEFLSDYGVRALSRLHRDRPYEFPLNGHTLTVRYQPAESDTGAFGGNSNWRGPIWFPVNYLLIESLQKFHHYYGDDFKVECPTGSGRFVTILDVANELSRRLTRIFLRDATGGRPVFGACAAAVSAVADETNPSVAHPSQRSGTRDGSCSRNRAAPTGPSRIQDAVSKIATDPQFRDYPLFYEYFDGDSGRGVGASHQCGWTGLVAKLLMPRDAAAGASDAASGAPGCEVRRRRAAGARV